MEIDLFTATKKYRVIYADPPWTFETHSAKGKGKSAEMHYSCMSLDDIAALPVSRIADDDCALLMWVTDPYLKKSFEVMEAWGFTYKTVGFYWAKQARADCNKWHYGTGYYTRANPEMCLLGTRGKIKRANADVAKLVVAPVREHSRKPDVMYDRIDRLFDGDKVELFARTTKPGWDSWGNETAKF